MVEDLHGLKAALVIAHPGHECRVYGWIRRLRPQVMLLTDGAGRDGHSRIGTSAAIFSDLGATQSSLFGVVTDRLFYDAVLKMDQPFFDTLTFHLADSLVESRIECVIGDSAEGAIMSHDLFREVRSTAIQLAEETLGYRIKHYEFPLESHPLAFPQSLADAVRRIELSPQEYSDKLQAARCYDEIAEFVEAAVDLFGEEAFSLEGIFPYSKESLWPANDATLEWERHGQRLSELGKYPEAITKSKHFDAISRGLARHVNSKVTVSS